MVTASISQEGEGATGPVRVTKYGIEGKVCSTYWNDQAANVTCRENGYAGGVALAYKVRTRRTNWLLTYNCTGTESRLGQCVQNSTNADACKSSMDVGVLCFYHSG